MINGIFFGASRLHGDQNIISEFKVRFWLAVHNEWKSMQSPVIVNVPPCFSNKLYRQMLAIYQV